MGLTRPVLRYHGGKWRIAPWIISHFPPHKIYVEAYGGAASILLRKPRCWQEVYNDLDGEVVNLFRILREPEQSARLQELLVLTPFARSEFMEAYCPAEDPIEQARRTIIRAGMGVGTPGASGRKTGFRGTLRSRGTVPAMDFAGYPEQLRAYTERLRGVVIENRPALDLIQKQDTPECLFYVDPPYPENTRADGGFGSYRFEMSDDDHRELARTLRDVAGMVVLSGYDCPLYQDLYAGWQRSERAARADCAGERSETLWMNSAASCKICPTLEF